MCLESAMSFGGVVEVEQGEPRWTIKGRAARLKVDPALWGVLTQGPLPEIGPAQVQFPLVSEELARQLEIPAVLVENLHGSIAEASVPAGTTRQRTIG